MMLKEFLVKAKLAAYASKTAEKNKLKDGANEFLYREDNLVYRDRYYGFNPFIGEEVVMKNNKVIWGMNYYGKIISKTTSPKKVYDFLKEALRRVKKESPFRGPKHFKKGNFEYVNEIKGTVNSFSGVEKILFKGNVVYILDCHGGAVKD